MGTAPSPLRVVIVEDEPLIRMLLADTLEEAGFAVIEAGRADMALNLLKAKAEEVHVVMTDIHMPGPMTGLDLARHAREHWPWILFGSIWPGGPRTWRIARRHPFYVKAIFVRGCRDND
jgi:CheY-like chemotaxis protein